MAVSRKANNLSSLTCVVAAASLLLLSTVLAAPGEKSLAIAGSVDVDPAVAPYVFLHVIDGRTGSVVRSATLDPTGTFSMSGLASTVSEVRAKVQLPADQFTVDEAASVLSAVVNTASPKLALKVVTSRANKAASSSSSAPAPSSATALSGVVTLAVLVAAWYARHIINNTLDRLVIKPPKPRKVMMTR